MLPSRYTSLAVSFDKMTRRTFLAAALAPPPQVLLDSDGMLYLEGKRTFLTGLYQLPNRANPWKDAADAGFKVVHCAADAKLLDTARAHGMYGWLTTGALTVAKRKEDQARIERVVNGFRDHPGVLFWETEDEPSFVNKEPRRLRVQPMAIKAAYALIRRLDPSRPVYLNHAPTNLVSTLQQYNAGGDMIATDVYPVIPRGIRDQYALWPDGFQGDLLNTSLSQVGPFVDKMRQVAGPKRGLWMVLQAFAWEMLRKEGDRDAKMIRYPTREEMRFMAWQAIVHGVTGLLWWGLQYTPGDVSLWDELSEVALELKAFAAELAAPPVKFETRLEYRDTGHSLDKGIEWIAKPSGSGVLLAAVNADKNPVDMSFTGLERFKTAKVVGEARSTRFARGILSDDFAPFGVHLYRLS